MNKFKKYEYMIFLIVPFLFIFSFSTIVRANSSDFSVTPILSNENKKYGFFNYNVSLNQKKQIKIKIKNHSNHKIKIKNFINDAYNSDGTITYNYLNENNDYNRTNPTLKSMIIGKKDKMITLKSKQSKIISFYIKIPKDGFSGEILGGINSENKSINHNVRFSTSIVLKMKEKDKKFQMNNLFINNLKADKDNLKFNLVNNQPFILSSYKLNVTIFDSNNKKVINQNEKYSMVPNSFSEYSLNNLDLSSGSYKMLFKLSNEKEKKTITKYFIIYGPKNNFIRIKNNYIAIVICLIIMILYFITLKIIKKRYRKE